ncbi:MAG: winged helix-turn-helix transcriptional regulator [Agathobacter sp.]
MKQPYYESTCPVEAALQLIGGKYKTIILWHLLNKTMRYSELHRLVPRATDKMLAQQLRELEKDGLVNRKVYPVIPPKTEYSLTEFGRTLEPVLNSLCIWGAVLYFDAVRSKYRDL